MSRKSGRQFFAGGTVSPPPGGSKRYPRPPTAPLTAQDWEAKLGAKERDVGVLRSALQAIAKSGETSCARCVNNADAARYALDQVDGAAEAP